MGLDVYSGTLTRYYTHHWKTKAQQYAESHGLKFQTIRSNQEEEDLSVEEVLDITTNWKDNIIYGLKMDDVLWHEDYQTTPYYTNKPDWDALNALLLYISAKYTNQEGPKTIERNINIYEHPIVKEFIETKDFQVSLFDGSGWWIPIKRNIMFNYVLPNDEKCTLATSSLLLAELERYNRFEWNEDEETIISWQKSEGYGDDYNTESLAKFAFSILWQAAKFSLENGTVIIFDY